MGCCNNHRPPHMHHKPHVPCPDNYVDVSRIDPKEYEEIALLLGMNECGFIYPVKKPEILEIFEVDGDGDKALFDDGKYKEVLTKDELGEYIKMSMEDFVKYNSTDDVELRKDIILKNAGSLKGTNLSGNKFNIATINQNNETVLGDTAVQTVIESIDRPVIRTFTNPGLGRAAFDSRMAYLSDVDANAGKIEDLKTDLTALDGRVTTNEGDIDALEGRVTVNEGDITELEIKTGENADKISSNTSKISDIETDLNTTKGRVTVNEGDIAGLKTKTQENAGKITDIETDLTATKGRVTVNEGDIADLKTKTSENASKIGNIETDLNTTKGRVTVNEGDIADLKTKTQENAGKISDLESEIASGQTDLTALEGRVSANETNIAGLDTKTQENAGKITDNASKISALESDVDTNKDEIDALKGRATANEGDIDALETITGDHEVRIDALEGDVSTNKSDIAGLKTKTQENAGKITDLEAEIASGQTDLTVLEGRVSVNETNIAGLDTKTADNLTKINDLKGELDATQSDLSTLEDRVEINESAIEVNQADIAALRTDMSKKEHFRGYYPTISGVLSIPNPEIGDYAYCAQTGTKWIYTGVTWQDAEVPVPDQTVEGADTVPNMDKATGEIGDSNKYARADHVHPSDITKADKTQLNDYLPLAGNSQTSRMSGDIWLGADNKVRLSDAGNSYINLDSNAQKIEIQHPGIGGIELNVPAGTVKVNGNEVVSYDSQNDINAKNNISLKNEAKVQAVNGANNKVNLIGADRYGNIEAGSTEDTFIIASKERPVVKEGSQTKQVAYLDELNASEAGLQAQITQNRNDIDTNTGNIDLNKTEINNVKSDWINQENFRGFYETASQITAIPNPKLNDFAYNGKTNTKWQYNGTTWYNTGENVPINSVDPSNESPKVNGVANPGSSIEYSRGDHVHPTDESRASSTEFQAYKTANDLKVGQIDTTVTQHGIELADYKLNVKPQVAQNTSDISALKTKAENIVKANWAETDSSKFSYIENKPDLGSMAYENKDNYASKNDLDNLPKSDWAETDNSKQSFIENKPTLGSMAAEDKDTYATKNDLNDIPKSDWTETDNSKKSFIENKPTLGSMADQDKDDYATKTALEAALGNKVTEIVAGANIMVETDQDGATKPKVSVTGVVTKITAGSNVSVTKDADDQPVISVTGIELPEKFTSSEIVEGLIGDSKDDLDYTKVLPIISGSTFSVNDIVIFENGIQAQVTAYNNDLATYSATIVQIPQEVSWGGIGGTLANQEDLMDALDLKVDKVEGKGLSTKDFTTAYETKLTGIQEGAQKNVQADWNQSDTSEDDFIKNKPQSATESTEGLIRLATGSEVILGTNDDTAVTPLKLKGNINNAISKAIQDGNYRIVDTIAERDALAATEGLLCYVKANDLIYCYDGTQWVEWKPGLQLDPDSKNVSVTEDGLLIENNYVIVENQAARDALPKYNGLHVYTEQTGGGSDTQFHKLTPEYRPGVTGATTNLANMPVDVDGFILGTNNTDNIITSDIQLVVANVGEQQFPTNSGTEGDFTMVYLDSYYLRATYLYTTGANDHVEILVKARENLSGDGINSWKICEYDPATGLITMKDDAAIAAVNNFIREHKPTGNIETHSSNSFTDSIWTVTVNWMPPSAISSTIRPTDMSQIKGIKFSPDYLRYYMPEMNGYPDRFLQWSGDNYISIYKTDTYLTVQTSLGRDYLVATFASGVTDVDYFNWNNDNLDYVNKDLATFFASNPTGAIEQLDSTSSNNSFLLNIGYKSDASTFWNSNSTSKFDIIGDYLFANSWLPMDSLGRRFAIQDAEGNNLVSVESVSQTSDTVVDIILYSSTHSASCNITVNRITNTITNVQGDLMSMINDSLAHYGKTFEEAKPIQVVNYPAGFTGETGFVPITGIGWEGYIHNIVAINSGSVSAEWNSMTEYSAGMKLFVSYTDQTSYDYTFIAKPGTGDIELYWDGFVIWTGHTSQNDPGMMGGSLISQSGDLKAALIESANQYGKTIDWDSVAIISYYPGTDSWLGITVDSGMPDNWLYYGVTQTVPVHPKKEYWNGSRWVELPVGYDSETMWLDNGVLKTNYYKPEITDLTERVVALETTVGTLNDYLENVLNGNG